MANPKLAMLIDGFTEPTINARWGSRTAGAVTLDTVNDAVSLTVGTAANSFPSFGSGGPYDATASSIFAEITVCPTGNGGTSTSLKLDAGSNNAVAIQARSRGSFNLIVTTAGVQVSTPLGTYDPHLHRWWKMSESGGSFTASTSPDGFNWTDLATAAYTFPVTAVSVYFQTGTSDIEPAGMAATIRHVNTMAGGVENPGWPRITDGWGVAWNANGGTIPQDRYVDVSGRTQGTMNTSGGRQYELDQVQAGTASLVLENNDGTLDPLNTGGPWAGHIQPYQPYQRSAMWPPSRNLLNQGQATGGDGYPTGSIPASLGVHSITDTTGGKIVADTTAYRGLNVFQFAVAASAPNSPLANGRICYTDSTPVTPGQPYRMQMWIRDVTASTTLSVWPILGWHGASSATPTTYVTGATYTLTGGTAAAWTQVIVAGTAPAGAYGMEVGLVLAASPTAACAVQVDSWQLETGTTTSAWTMPGIWYDMYSGFTEEWPSAWDMQGTYGTVSPTAVDALALLSQQQLDDPLTEEINSHGPRWLYKLDDPSGSTSASDATGNFPGAQLAVSKYGAGTWTFGSAIASTDATGTYTGSSGTVSTLNNPNPGTNLLSAATFLKLTSAGIKGPADPTLWVRMIAFRYTGPAITSGAYLWTAMDGQRTNGSPSGSRIAVFLGIDGKPGLWMQGPTGAGSTYVFGGATNCVDGDWHLLVFGYNQAFNQVMASQDGAGAAFYGSVPTTYTPTGLIADNVGSFVDATVGNGTYLNFKGDISFVCEFADWFSSTPLTNLYAAWKSACSGDSTATRYSRILKWAGYTGPSSIQTGLTTSMGPAATAGQDAVTALQGVVDTEGGAHFVARDGTVTFRGRNARYNNLVPAYTFGEQAGEWPYEDCQLVRDPTRLANAVEVTQASTGQIFPAKDDTSTKNFMPRTLTRTINSSDPLECLDAANYLLSRYKQPATRVNAIKLHPSAYPALWPVCLSLELGTRIRVMRRPPFAPVIQLDVFAENLAWSMDDQGEAFLTIQGSPVDLTPYAVFASWHTTLATAPPFGATLLTVNASQDNSNPLGVQLAPGQQLVLGLGTAAQETVTVASVGATSAGWTTATINLAGATTKAHTVGTSVCEPLPAGTTDPTTWDAVATFDAVAFAY